MQAKYLNIWSNNNTSSFPHVVTFFGCASLVCGKGKAGVHIEEEYLKVELVDFETIGHTTPMAMLVGWSVSVFFALPTQMFVYF